jgi:hypothetical protein
MKPRHLLVFVPLVLALFTALPAFGSTITVTNTDDSGPGSLRNAISMAVSGDTIDFSLTYPATITLTSGTLTIGTSLSISGPGASNLAISGNNAVAVVQVNSGITVGISGVTIENGKASFGGGIINAGTLTLTNSNVSTNSTSYLGGGIYNNYGTLTLNNSTVSKNTTYSYGGGIYNSSGTVTLTDSTVSANSSSFDGGGILNNHGSLTLTNSTISGNSGPYGAGIFNINQGALTITSSTVSGNSESIDGAGIYNYDYGTLTLINSTVWGNSSGYSGGGIFNFAGATLTVTNSTVSGNSAPYGGGISNYNATMILKSTLMVNGGGGNCSLSGGVATSDGYNLSNDGSCSSVLNSVTDQNNNTSTGLDPNGLQENGGPTKTMALLSTSAAVDAIPEADCTLAAPDEATTVSVDQRGVTRPQGSACDIGAFELVESDPFSFFSAKLDIHGDSSFDLNSKFTLGMGSNGINPLTEMVKLQVGPYEATIPAGSFHQLKNGKKKGSYVFSGVISGASVSIQIVPLGENSYQFKATASPVNFSAVTNPVVITLTIGQNTGTTSVYADF